MSRPLEILLLLLFAFLAFYGIHKKSAPIVQPVVNEWRIE